MALHLEPVRIPVPGDKVIEELAGRVATGHNNYSVAHMTAPAGWDEPAQTPEFDEVTYVISGEILVHTADGTERVRPGAGILTRAGEKVRYEAGPEGADYVAVCVPAFSEEGARRA
ncbi:cupin domain-containing protein [Ornithinimicrobium cryptoxanthini]|uniref:Cupin n=1 Tax=Ornithinimicrobium cryptoxanthini TaxID=2934161 RepID=A0ABY4YKH8_9MICO|nr:AraC family ligand binding domain-containing protein [Ornithinimicrobium cryptoxanthini]USQ77221.1 cupin [Ornithinimicrobium cryptoxanthini]